MATCTVQSARVCSEMKLELSSAIQHGWAHLILSCFLITVGKNPSTFIAPLDIQLYNSVQSWDPHAVLESGCLSTSVSLPINSSEVLKNIWQLRYYWEPSIYNIPLTGRTRNRKQFIGFFKFTRNVELGDGVWGKPHFCPWCDDSNALLRPQWVFHYLPSGLWNWILKRFSEVEGLEIFKCLQVPENGTNTRLKIGNTQNEKTKECLLALTGPLPSCTHSCSCLR